MTDTANALTDFDMCLALAQLGINSQLEEAWRIWKKRNSLDTHLEIPIPKSNGQGMTKRGLSADLGVPAVDLNVKDGTLSQVRFTLALKSGRLSYIDEDGELASHAFRDWEISFLVDLDRKPISLKELRHLDDASAAQAEQLIQDSDLSDSVFTIEYLFMKFTDLNLVLPGNMTHNVPLTLDSGIVATLGQALNELFVRKVGDGLLLGTVVYPSREQGKRATFALADFGFKVTANAKYPNASSLDYLGVFTGRGMPAQFNEARSRFTDHWIDGASVEGPGNTVHGLLAINGPKFQNYIFGRIFQRITAAYPRAVIERLPGGLRISHIEGSATEEDGGWLAPDSGVNHSAHWGVTVRPGDDGYELEGEIATYLNVWVGRRVSIAEFGGTGAQRFKGNIPLAASTDGLSFSLSLDQPSFEFGDIESRTRTDGMADMVSDVSNLLKTVFGSTSIEDTIAEQVGTAINRLRETLAAALDGWEAEMRDSAFVPPGVGIFTFQNPRFSPAKDLLLDVIWKQTR